MPVRNALLAISVLLAGAPIMASAADAGPNTDARQTHLHDQQVKAAENEVAAKQRDVERFQKLIEDSDKRAAKLDNELAKTKDGLAEVEDAKSKLAEAKATMEAADARVQREFNANHSGGSGSIGPHGASSSTGGATEEAVKEQEAAQKEWQRLRRVAASADSDLPLWRQRVSALEKQRKGEDKKKEDYLKRSDEAQSALDAARQKLADIQATQAVAPSPSPAGADQDGGDAAPPTPAP